MIYTLDFVILRYTQDEGLQALLLKRSKEPFEGQYAIPGGWIFEDKDEDLSDAFYRILDEKVRHPMSHIEQVLTHGSKKRDPRGWSTTTVYLAFMENPDVEIPADMKWLSISGDASLDLPFDHEFLIRETLKRLASKAQYSTLPIFLAGERFTLSLLEKAYETILGGPVNTSAFRKRMEKTRFVEPTEDFERITGRRPTRYFRRLPGAEPEFYERLMTTTNQG